MCCRCIYHDTHPYVQTDVAELEDMFGATPTGDFSPFNSKAHALAYMLINSPRPMVGTFHI